MEEMILSFGQTAGGEVYVIYVLLLMLFNSIVKHIFDNENMSTTKIVGVTSAIVLFVFWLFGAGFWKLVLYTFALFGFFDYFGRYIEKAYMWLFVKIADWISDSWKWFKGLFDFRLFNK